MRQGEIQTYLSPAEAATILGLTTQRIRQLVDAGTLPAVRSALGRLIERDGVVRLKAEREAARKPAVEA